jgi:hypothetical protein
MLEDGSYHWSREALTALTRSARGAGRGAVTSGRWLVDAVVDMAPHVPVRDLATLSDHHGGLTGARLARSVVKAAGKASAAIGGAAGGLMSVQELSLAGALAIPFELAAETALVVLVELKLVTELHHVAGDPLPDGPRRRTVGVVGSWLSGTAVDSDGGETLTPAARAHLGRVLKQRLAHSLVSVAPLLTGAAAAAWINRRTTLAIGKALTRDLGLVVGGVRSAP